MGINNITERLISQLKSSDDEKWYSAANAIVNMGPSILTQLLEMMNDPDECLCRSACLILPEIRNHDQDINNNLKLYHDAINKMIYLLTNNMSSDVRAAAAAGLGKLDEVDNGLLVLVVPALIKAAEDQSPDVRLCAASALGNYSQWDNANNQFRTDVCKTILRLMDDVDDDVRDWATSAIHIGEYDTPNTRSRLWKALEDPNGEVRGEAAYALAQFGDLSFKSRLYELLRHDTILSPLYFEAAEMFKDPYLFSAVLTSAERWRKTLQEGEEMDTSIVSAIDVLHEISVKNTDLKNAEIYVLALHTNDKALFALWVATDHTTFIYIEDNVIPVWSSLEYLNAYVVNKGIVLRAEAETASYDFDALEKWLSSPRKNLIDSNIFLNYWNLFDDAAIALNISWLARWNKYNIYDKLFAGAIPWLTTNPAYVPTWTKSEAALIANVLRDGMRMLIEHLDYRTTSL